MIRLAPADREGTVETLHSKMTVTVNELLAMHENQRQQLKEKQMTCPKGCALDCCRETAAAAMDRDWPQVGPCGPCGFTCGNVMWAYKDTFRSCPNHAAACAAGPRLVLADEQFRARVLRELDREKKYWRAMEDRDALYAIGKISDTIRELDYGHMRDAMREGKGK